MSSSLAFRQARRLSTSAAATSSAAISNPSTTTATNATSLSTSKPELKELSKDDTSITTTLYDAQDYKLKRLAKFRRFSEIKTLLESYKADPKIKNEEFLSSIIRSYGVAGMYDQALKTYNGMEKSATPRSTISFNSLLAAFVKARKFENVVKMFDERPKRHGFEPDKVSYGVLIKAYCGMGDVGLAMEKLKEMEEKGVEITSITYTTILHGCFQKGAVEEAEKVWKDMVAKGCVDVGGYNVRIMNAHGGNVEDVKELIEEMRSNGFTPDVISYNYLMTSYCKGNLMDEAIKVFDDLGSHGCQPNAATFRTLVFHLCKNEQFETAHGIFNQSVVAERIPDFSTSRYLVEGLVKNSKVEEAKEIIRCIKEKFPANMVKAWGKLEKQLGLVIADNDGGDENATVGSAKVASA